ncbi:M15 family metallopeptidase [Nocardioides sp.]|uniref:M15 family metallopeptidase n=1 Tax=Nocardioides sp. TaxID=35761 RepID=UPI002ED44B81
MRPRRALAGLALAAALATGCTTPPATAPPEGPSPTAGPTTPGSSASREPTDDETASRTPGPASTDGTLSEPAYGRGSTPPPWLFQRKLPEDADGFGEVRPTPPALRRRAFTLVDQVPALPGHGYASRIESPAPDDVLARSTWSRDCPVGRDELAWLRLTFWGFDARRHTGELLVNASVAADVDRAFRRLWEARFPLEQVLIVRSIDEEAPPTGDGNGTGAFVCRSVTGGSSFSQHAYGLAIDVNTFQNPYHKDGVVLPELASSYLDRRRVRPGMVTPEGPVIAAFRDIGWSWGGDWTTLKDYQHFSANGR